MASDNLFNTNRFLCRLFFPTVLSVFPPLVRCAQKYDTVAQICRQQFKYSAVFFHTYFTSLYYLCEMQTFGNFYLPTKSVGSFADRNKVHFEYLDGRAKFHSSKMQFKKDFLNRERIRNWFLLEGRPVRQFLYRLARHPFTEQSL